MRFFRRTFGTTISVLLLACIFDAHLIPAEEIQQRAARSSEVPKGIPRYYHSREVELASAVHRRALVSDQPVNRIEHRGIRRCQRRSLRQSAGDSDRQQPRADLQSDKL